MIVMRSELSENVPWRAGLTVKHDLHTFSVISNWIQQYFDLNYRYAKKKKKNPAIFSNSTEISFFCVSILSGRVSPYN